MHKEVKEENKQIMNGRETNNHHIQTQPQFSSQKETKNNIHFKLIQLIMIKQKNYIYIHN